VFHGISTHIDTQGYGAGLSAKVAASGSDSVLGVVYVGYNCEDQLGLYREFVYYTRKHGRNFIWCLVQGAEDARWLLDIYKDDPNLRSFLKERLGLI